MQRRLAIVTTHPIQYYAPIFQLLSERNRIQIKVFYTLGTPNENHFDEGFNQKISWDIPLLSGYESEFCHNEAKIKSLTSFYGIQNPDLIDRIKHYEPNAILVIGWNYSSHLKILRHFKNKVKILFRGDSTLLDEKRSRIKTLLRRGFLKFVYRHVDTAFYVGQANKAYFLQHGLKEKQLSFTPHAIDNQRFGLFNIETQKKVENLRNEYQIPSNRWTFLFAGKFEKKKNPQLIIQAAKKFPEAIFILVGNGELETELKSTSCNLQNVYFLPFQNQQMMPIVYRLAEVFILPSTGPGETWGLAVNEAMACGLAILVSNKCGCSYDLIPESKNGFIFDPFEPEGFFKQIKFFIENPQKIDSMKKQSVKTIQEWNFDHICQKIEDKVLL